MYELRPHATMGATITGLDVSKEYDQATKERLYKDWLDYGVLVFRAPGVTAEQHLRLSEVFGELWQHPIVSVRTKDNPNLVQLPDKEMAAPIFMKDGQMWFGYIFWHQDTAYTTNICKGSIPNMVLQDAVQDVHDAIKEGEGMAEVSSTLAMIDKKDFEILLDRLLR